MDGVVNAQCQEARGNGLSQDLRAIHSDGENCGKVVWEVV